MITQINGQHYRNLLDYGVRNLALYEDRVNALNVFPVPDGDTGTNMLVTLQSGFAAIQSSTAELPDAAKRFATAVSFAARGNSGVIVSQFFKGFSQLFFDENAVDYATVARAMENGVKCAYQAVPNPVEGTLLTVLREASAYANEQLHAGKILSVNDLFDTFLDQARTSLENTPKLLEVLKSAGVVDSGGAGIVCVFEGMQKYLNGEELPESAPKCAQKTEDYSKFDRNSTFEFGYCTEFLLQLTNGKEPFCQEEFLAELKKLGNSLVTVFEGDKVKIHIHAFTPELVLMYCHRFGEFLSMKIENMSVQHEEIYAEEAAAVAPYGEGNPFSVVAVAHNHEMEKRFLEVGADHVMVASYQQPPTASDFIEAFCKSVPGVILVFPNNKNTELAALQAQRMYEDAQVFVIKTRSDAECYAALPMIDFTCENMEELLPQIEEVIDNVTVVTMTQASKNACIDDVAVQCGDFVATIDRKVLSAGTSLDAVAGQAIRKVMDENEFEVVTAFVNPSVSDGIKDGITRFVADNFKYTEVTVIDTDDVFYQIILSFE